MWVGKAHKQFTESGAVSYILCVDLGPSRTHLSREESRGGRGKSLEGGGSRGTKRGQEKEAELPGSWAWWGGKKVVWKGGRELIWRRKKQGGHEEERGKEAKDKKKRKKQGRGRGERKMGTW